MIRQYNGQIIRKLRELHDLTQEQLGRKARLTYIYVGKIEKGKANPSFKTLSRIANVLEVPVNDLT